MQGLWILTRVSDEKRQEMLQSLSVFVAEQTMRPCRRFVLQDVHDESLIAWLGYWRTGEELERFLASPTFQAMKGAADTLGTLEEVKQFSSRQLVPSESTRL